MSNPLQNFYSAQITQDWSIGTGNFYVSIKPTTSVGRLVVSPSSDSLREIIEYTNTGTDGNGDYIVISVRGVGGTTEQSHTVGEKVRMNITAEDWEDMRDDIDSIVAAGAMNASETVKGLVEIATDAQVIAGTDIGETGASLVATPSQIKTNYSRPIITRTYNYADSPITWNKPTGLTFLEVELWGGGGSGGSSSNGSFGGGGGAYVTGKFPASSLGTTETITIGAGGAGVVNDNAGNIGGNTTFGSLLTAYGGGGGAKSNGAYSGGGGGGSLSVGGSGQSNNSGGSPLGGVGGGATDAAGGDSIMGGGGGGADGTGSQGLKGGDSFNGGGGGGGKNADASGNGGDGGASFYGGGGGGGSAGTSSGTKGSGGVSKMGGAGGNGSQQATVATSGTVPSGGGGGGGTSQTSGAGGNGQARIIEYYN